MGEFEDGMESHRKTLLLTGASRGIGHATACAFADAGWRVITVSRQAFDSKCPWDDGAQNHIQIDLSDIEAVQSGVSEINKMLSNGRLDALVNNAGISPKNESKNRLDFLHTDYERWLDVFNVNLFSAAILTRGLADALEAASGSVVNVTSIAGSRVHPFAGAAYACSKAALTALTREMARDLGGRGIRVNALAPGEIDTAILSPGTQEIVDRDIPLRRLGTPQEVAETIRFLCSEQAAYVHGAELHINGGQHV